MDDKPKNYEVVNTKIAKPIYDRLMVLLRRKNLNYYRMFQNFCDVLIHNMDDAHNLTPETEKVMGVFENMIGWESNFNLSDPTAQPEVAEAIYFLTAQGKNGTRVVDVERPFFGQWKQTLNTKDILDRYIRLAHPQLHRRLTDIARRRQCGSLLELLLDMTAEMEADEQKRELLSDFEDNSRGDFGQKFGETRYRRKMVKTPDMFNDELKVES